MNILFLHPNFPGQFANLANVLGRSGQHTVVFITANSQGQIPGVQKIVFKQGKTEVVHHYLKSTTSALRQGQLVGEILQKIKAQGFYPDLILGHSGWGSTLFVKEVFPKAVFLGYFEWFNRPQGTVHDFDPAEPLSIEEACQIHTANIPLLLDLVACDAGVTPTNWQRSVFPTEHQAKIRVLHEGIHTDVFVPRPGMALRLPQLDLSGVPELITYVGRGLEPYRGFPQFIEGMRHVLQRRPHAQVVVVGSDRIAYGSKPAPQGKTYGQWLRETVDLDWRRVHFTGLLPREQYLQVLQASSVHVYLTYPFVLSWSMLEAMSVGCAVVGSRTAPVEEVIQDGYNGVLADFYSPQDIADKVCAVLAAGPQTMRLRQQARQTVVERFGLSTVMPQWLDFLKMLIMQNR